MIVLDSTLCCTESYSSDIQLDIVGRCAISDKQR